MPAPQTSGSGSGATTRIRSPPACLMTPYSPPWLIRQRTLRTLRQNAELVDRYAFDAMQILDVCLDASDDLVGSLQGIVLEQIVRLSSRHVPAERCVPKCGHQPRLGDAKRLDESTQRKAAAFGLRDEPGAILGG